MFTLAIVTLRRSQGIWKVILKKKFLWNQDIPWTNLLCLTSHSPLLCPHRMFRPVSAAHALLCSCEVQDWKSLKSPKHKKLPTGFWQGIHSQNSDCGEMAPPQVHLVNSQCSEYSFEYSSQLLQPKPGIIHLLPSTGSPSTFSYFWWMIPKVHNNFFPCKIWVYKRYLSSRQSPTLCPAHPHNSLINFCDSLMKTTWGFRSRIQILSYLKYSSAE